MDETSMPEGFPVPSSLNRVLPLREQMYRLLRGAIVKGQMKPGQSVDELEIADRLGISRTPVREAVKKLSDEGLINVLAQSGTYVALIDRKQVEEAYIIRTALELESVARAAPVITESQVHDLEDIVAKLARAFEQRAFGEAIARDDEFHQYIAQISGLSMLWRVVDISKAPMDRCSYLNLGISGLASQAIAEHKAIVRALKTGHPDTSRAAMRTHLEHALHEALKVLDTLSEPGTESANHRPQRAPSRPREARHRIKRR